MTNTNTRAEAVLAALTAAEAVPIYAILNSAIPATGRGLTSTEAASLRTRGVPCSAAWHVNQDGYLWSPARRGGLDRTGIRACWRD